MSFSQSTTSISFLETRSSEHPKKGNKKHLVYPEPVNWHGANIPPANKKSEPGKVSSNDTVAKNMTDAKPAVENKMENATVFSKPDSDNCTTPSCSCKKTCEPKLVASVSTEYSLSP